MLAPNGQLQDSNRLPFCSHYLHSLTSRLEMGMHALSMEKAHSAYLGFSLNYVAINGRGIKFSFLDYEKEK